MTNKIRFLLAMAQWNSRKAKFFKNKEEKSRPSERSGKRVRFGKLRERSATSKQGGMRTS